MPPRHASCVRPPFVLKSLVAAFFIGTSLSASAGTFSVANEAQLQAAIIAINASPGANFIEFTADILLTSALPPILNTVTIKGNKYQLSGDGNERLLVVGASTDANGPRILVQVNDLKMKDGNAQGGAGANGGGGGLGAGGAVLVNSSADVVLNNVTMVSNTVTGGAGAAGTGGGGGGLGGAGGAGTGGGGGGLAGNGGAGGVAGGGGGGIAGNGGAGTAVGAGGGGGYSGVGGAGGAAGVAGGGSVFWAPGSAGAGTGGAAGGASGGGGGGSDAGGSAGGGGFGGQSGSVAGGGKGGFGGGGGGSTNDAAGSGGFGGGGGGSIAGAAGNGGFGGGGGGSSSNNAGSGGFGGGGGSSVSGTGGAGGFGGGGGAGATAGTGGAGGGAGSAANGGGGAGLGGAVFVAQGGGLTVTGTTSFSGGSSTGGSGANTGASSGSGLFLQGSGNLTFQVNGSQTLTIADNISDSVGAARAAAPGSANATLAPAGSYDSWNLNIRGGGPVPVDTNNPSSGSTYGLVVLGGTNTYSGDTYISGANVAVGSVSALGVGGVVALDDGGIILNGGLSFTRDVVVNSGGGRIGVVGGVASLDNTLSGSGAMVKVGDGDLHLNGAMNLTSSSWVVQQGGLLLDNNASLGTTTLTLNGGGIKYNTAFNDLRALTLGTNGGYIDNNGFNNIQITKTISGLGAMDFNGTGSVVVAAQMFNVGGTNINAGTVTGRIGFGDLKVASGATYNLGTANQTVGQLSGSGVVNLGTGINAHNLTLNFGFLGSAVAANWAGVISGDGQLIKQGVDGELQLTGLNTYTGGTVIQSGTVTVSQDANVGTGDVTLAGGTFKYGTNGDYTSAIAFDLANGKIGTIDTGGNNITLNGLITGGNAGSMLTLAGGGVLTLNHANSYNGITNVADGALLALANPLGLGNSTLQLSNGGGLQLLADVPVDPITHNGLVPVVLAGGDGVINTNGFVANITNALSGSGNLVKAGAGDLHLLADNTYTGNTSVQQGTLYLGAAGSSLGTLGAVGSTGSTDIATDATLSIERDGTITLANSLTGSGALVMNGSGSLQLATVTNLFNGNIVVSHGNLSFYDDGQLGRGPVQIDHGASLELLASLNPGATPAPNPDLLHAVVIGAGGGALQSSTGNSWVAGGNISGAGLLSKTGAGTVILMGVASQTGGTEVVAGTLQIGQGLSGTLLGNVAVDALGTLIFGRDDITQYDGIISGGGSVHKSGAGDLVLTGNQLFSGTIHVDTGNLRVGLGGTTGSLNGNVALAAGTTVLFDRSNNALFNGGTSGAGSVQKNGQGMLVVTGDMDHTGGTRVTSGYLQIGNGGTTGNIHGNVVLGTGTLAVNRSDMVTLDANLSGDGGLWQRGSGTTILTGNNSQTQSVDVSNGRLQIDSDARLGAGTLVMNGGLLQFGAAFNNLRNIYLFDGGGGLDTNGFDITYAGQVSRNDNGNDSFSKDGAGTLTMTGILGTNQVNVLAGTLVMGDGSGNNGLMAGNADISSGATFAFNRPDDFVFSGLLTGTGTFEQRGTGLLQLTANNSAFAGSTAVTSGKLRIDSNLGGDLSVATGARVQGNGKVLGNANIFGTLAPGNSIGTFNIGGNLTLSAGSTTEIEINGTSAVSQSDLVAVTGTATLGGALHLLALPGDYTQNSKTFTILTAAGGVSGQFASTVNDLIFLTPTLSYGANQVDMTVARNATPFQSISYTYNQKQTSAAIDTIEANNPTNPLALQIAGMNANTARAAYDALSGDSLLSAANVGSRTGYRFNDLLSVRSSRLGLASRGGSGFMEKDLADMRIGQMPSLPQLQPQPANNLSPTSAMSTMNYDGPTSKIEGLWVQANAIQLQEDADADIGSASSTFSGSLLALGTDGYWSNNLILGFGAGYLQGKTSFDNRQSQADTTGTFVGTYMRWEPDSGWQYKATLSLAQQSTDQTRDISFAGKAQSTAQITSATGAFEAGLALHLGSYGLRPYVVATVQGLKRDDIKETGAGSANLEVAGKQDIQGEVGVGTEISRPWLTNGARWAQLQMGFAVLQPFGATQPEQTVNFAGQSNTFNIRATPNDSIALQLTLGMEWYLTPALAIWGGYEGRISDATQEHNGVLSAQYRW